MRILIVRTSAMGDVVHCLPVLSALRRKLPKARIGWVVEEGFAPLLADHPELDERIVVRMRAWRRRLTSAAAWREMRTARAAIRSFDADVAFDLMGNHKGGFLTWLSGARRRIGAPRNGRRERSSAIWINEPVEVDGIHAVDRALGLVAALDADPRPADFGGEYLFPHVPVEARKLLEAQARPYVVIQAGAGWGNKTYPPAWWGAVARTLRQQADLDAWVPIAPGERHLAEGIVDASDGAARSVDASLPFLAALIRQSRLVLGGDTGPIHLAHAIGAPVLCLIGPTDPERNGPYEAPERVLWHRLPCSGCYKRFAEPKACLLNLTPEVVSAKALELLKGSPNRQRLQHEESDA